MFKNTCPYCEEKIRIKYDEHLLNCFKEQEFNEQNIHFPCEVCEQLLDLNIYFDHMIDHYDKDEVKPIGIGR